MSRLSETMATATVRALALLPLGALYRLSDITFAVLYHLVRYRRRLVRKNIDMSFPDLDEADRCRIVRKFYRNFADYFFETVKLAHISDRQIKKRMRFENVELAERFLSQGQPVVAYFAHTGNWEWATSVGLWSETLRRYRLGQVYRPLKSEWADRLMLALRARFNTRSYPKSTVFRDLLREKAAGEVTMTGFMSDQKPSHGDRVHILEFLNRPTAVITGTETVARRLGAAAVYWEMSKQGRGRYTVTMRLLSNNVADTADFEVTDRYFQLLDRNIRRQPDIWLWSHNRWKHPVKLSE